MQRGSKQEKQKGGSPAFSKELSSHNVHRNSELRNSRESMADEHSVEYVVCVPGGFEDLAAACIAQQLGIPVSSITPVCVPPRSDNWGANCDVSVPGHVFPGQAGVGKLLFSLPRPLDADGWRTQRMALTLLPCISALLAPIAFASGLPLTAEAVALTKQVMGAAADRWASAVRTWRHCRLEPLHATPADDALSFRANAVRDGMHAFKSVDLAQAIGAAVHLQRRLRVDLTGFDLEVVAFLLQGELLVGINLISGKSMKCNPLSASNDL